MGAALAQGATSIAPHRPYYAAAKIRWESAAAVVSGALQNVPLVSAVSDLRRGLAVGSGNTTGYSAAIAELRDFESIPLTSETPSETRRARRDWAALNAFFDVSRSQARVLDGELPSGAWFVAAQRAYEREPHGKGDGVVAAYLRAAVGDLRREAVAQPTRSILYGAAIADLLHLSTASASDVATQESVLSNPYVQDIFYLNAYFQTERLQTSVSS